MAMLGYTTKQWFGTKVRLVFCASISKLVLHEGGLWILYLRSYVVSFTATIICCHPEVVGQLLKNIHDTTFHFSAGQFGCLEWSHSETHLLYVAEKKCPKTKSFFDMKSDETAGNTTGTEVPKVRFQ